MEFCWITIKVSDIEASLKFYHELLELPIATRFGNNGVEIAMLGHLDQPKIELLYNPHDAEASSGNRISVGIQVPSLEQALELVKEKNIPVLAGPFEPTPDTKFFFVADPDGVAVQLVESGKRE